MPEPVTLAPSQIFHLNTRVPKDIAAQLRGTTITLPVNGEDLTVRISDKVVVSLRTREPREARKRFAPAFEALTRHFEAVRVGPKPLVDEQIVALAGEAYRDFVCEVEPKLGLGAFEASSDAHEEAIQDFMTSEPLDEIMAGMPPLSRERAQKTLPSCNCRVARIGWLGIRGTTSNRPALR